MGMGKIARAGGWAASAAVVLLLLQGSAPTASADDNHSQGKRTLTFHVLFSDPSYTDLGAPGFSAADVIVFHDQLQQGTQTVGDEVGSCVMVDATGLSNCSGVVQLTNRGTIAFSFVNLPPPHKVLAITGGSGQFATARGDGTLDENGDGTGTLVLKLQP
jgi:hypothetical protein